MDVIAFLIMKKLFSYRINCSIILITIYFFVLWRFSDEKDTFCSIRRCSFY